MAPSGEKSEAHHLLPPSSRPVAVAHREVEVAQPKDPRCTHGESVRGPSGAARRLAQVVVVTPRDDLLVVCLSRSPPPSDYQRPVVDEAIVSFGQHDVRRGDEVQDLDLRRGGVDNEFLGAVRMASYPEIGLRGTSSHTASRAKYVMISSTSSRRHESNLARNDLFWFHAVPRSLDRWSSLTCSDDPWDIAPAMASCEDPCRTCPTVAPRSGRAPEVPFKGTHIWPGCRFLRRSGAEKRHAFLETAVIPPPAGLMVSLRIVLFGAGMPTATRAFTRRPTASSLN